MCNLGCNCARRPSACASLKQVIQQGIAFSQLSDPDTRSGFSQIKVDRIASYGQIKRAGSDDVDRISTVVIMHYGEWRSARRAGLRIKGLTPKAGKSIASGEVVDRPSIA